jgi:hypothetical protein
VPALFDVSGGRNIALLNSGVTNAERVIREQPHGWDAGPSSSDRSFAQWPVWVITEEGR